MTVTTDEPQARYEVYYRWPDAYSAKKFQWVITNDESSARSSLTLLKKYLNLESSIAHNGPGEYWLERVTIIKRREKLP